MLSGLALNLVEQDKLLEAEKLLQEALEIHRKHLGNENPHLGVALNNLGGLLYKERKFTKAEPLLREAVDLYRKNPDYPVEKQTTAFAALGKVLAEQGNLVEAEALQSGTSGYVAKAGTGQMVHWRGKR